MISQTERERVLSGRDRYRKTACCVCVCVCVCVRERERESGVLMMGSKRDNDGVGQVTAVVG